MKITRSFLRFAVPPLLAIALLLPGTAAAGLPGDDTDLPTLAERMPHMDFRLETSLSGLVFTENDMYDTYGAVPVAQAGLALDVGPTTQLLFAAGYGRRTGTLDVSTPTFDYEGESELSLVPITTGLRLKTNSMETVRINLGLFLQVVRVKERHPYYEWYPHYDVGERETVEWGQRFLLTLGPEFRPRDRRWTAGAEALIAFGGTDSGSSNGLDTSLTGFGCRVFWTWKLGTIEESPRGQEVQP